MEKEKERAIIQKKALEVMKKVERGVREEKEEKEGKEKAKAIMKNQKKYAAVKMVKDQEVRDQEGKCQNQEDIALMKRNLVRSALQDLPWRKRLSQHGRLANLNVRAI